MVTDQTANVVVGQVVDTGQPVRIPMSDILLLEQRRPTVAGLDGVVVVAMGWVVALVAFALLNRVIEEIVRTGL